MSSNREDTRSPSPAILHPICGPPGSRLDALLGAGLEPVAPMRRVTGCFERVVAGLSGAASASPEARAGLPDGAATAEAVAVRLRRDGIELRWGPAHTVADLQSLLRLCRARGRSSVELVRTDPSLLSELQIGNWFDARLRLRALRRLAAHRLIAPEALALRSPRLLAAVADVAFWVGVRESATPPEWRRLTRSSYVVLVYHRFAGERKPGQERVDISPARFRRQLRFLRLAGFRPLSADEILAFHAGAPPTLAARSFAISVDDALLDCVAPLREHADWTPLLFVCTHELGGSAHWLMGEPVASWDDVADLAAAGVAIASHGRRHESLTHLTADRLTAQLAGSLADLRERLSAPAEVVAYPYGAHNTDVCEAARAAGYRAAFTTQKGRNGAGTHAFALRRVSVHRDDGMLAVLWKVITGEALPGTWLRLRSARAALDYSWRNRSIGPRLSSARSAARSAASPGSRSAASTPTQKA